MTLTYPCGFLAARFILSLYQKNTSFNAVINSQKYHLIPCKEARVELREIREFVNDDQS